METKKLGLGLLRAILAERVITVLTRGIDGLIIWFVIQDPPPGISGAVNAFVFVTPLNFLFSLTVVVVSDILYRRGADVIGIETLRELEHSTLQRRHFVRRTARWILRSRRLIFWVGSWFYLDPDYVTLLLRKKGEGYVKMSLRLTLPSAILCMTVWVPIYWAAVQGYWWAVWLVD